MTCKCVNVGMGTYDNQRTFPIPSNMKKYKESRVKAGLSPFISVDKCCVPDLVELWHNGVITLGCCCGHKKSKGFINVDPDDFGLALSLGFEKYIFSGKLGGVDRCDTVKFPKEK